MPANANGKKENILTSWKEIAAYLDRDVRTCVRWEQRYGLPVHRLDRDSKAKVFAYRDEIDRWLADRSAAEGAPSRLDEAPHRPWSRPLLILAALAGLAAAYILYLRPALSSVPADFRIRGAEFVVTNARGRELWSRDTKLEDLMDVAYYREHFQALRHDKASLQPIWPNVMIRDLNRDGRPEVLFAPKTESEEKEGILIVFDDKGGELWRFAGGAAHIFGGKLYRPEYRIWGFDVDDFEGDGRLEVLVISIQKPDWPCQAVLLDEAGRVKGEYWNAGYFFDADAGDVDLDGTKELLLSGVNNESARGCLAVFKPGRLQGSSPQTTDEFKSPELGPGQQSAYILFPRSDVQAARYVWGDPVNYFWIPEGGGFTAETTDSHLIYDFDRSLRCRSVTLSHEFQSLHRELAGAGLVHSALGDAYKRDLLDDFRYWVDGRWSPSPPVAVQAR